MVGTLEAVAHRRWHTADVESRRALAYWVDTICSSFLEVDIDSPQRSHFSAGLDQSEFGPATLSLLTADTQTVRRTRARIARSRDATFFLLQLRAGRMRLRQYGRDTEIQAGDCIVVDCNEPYEANCLLATECMVLRFPEAWLKTWVPAPQDAAARALSGSSGWGKALSAALSNLTADCSDSFALPAGIVADQLAALLALATERDQTLTTSTEKLTLRIVRKMRDHCLEPDLTPATIAAKEGISKRYLHFLLAKAGTTFVAELMRARLDCAQRLLRDDRFAALPVGEIAARCGFAQPSHFARRFRASFGTSPVEYRRSTLPGQSQRS